MYPLMVMKDALTVESLYNEDLPTLIDQFTKKEDFSYDLLKFSELLSNKEAEKMLIIFYVEILSRCLRKNKDIKVFYNSLLEFINSNLSYKNSILILKVVKTISNTRMFVPIGIPLIYLLEEAISREKLVKSNKKYSLEDIRLSSDDLKTEELQLFVVENTVSCLKENLSKYSNSIGFPELSVVIEKELKNRCKRKEFKEFIGELIKKLKERREFIEEKREEKFEKEKIEYEKVLIFEKELKPIQF